MVEFDFEVLEPFAGLFGFGAALVGEVRVEPAAELVLEVPFGLAVPDEDDFVAFEGGF